MSNKIRGFKKVGPVLLLVLTLSLFFAFRSDEDSVSGSVLGHEGVNTESAASSTHENPAEHKEEFNVVETIMEHVTDSHDWHLWGQTSIPLPVILYNSERGLAAFMSNKFEHGHKTYKGYKLEKNKIVAVNEMESVDAHHATVNEEVTNNTWDVSITKTTATILISITILLLVFIAAARRYSRNPDKAPKGIQSAVEPLILFIRDDVAKASIGEKKYMRYVPFLLTIFFFIFVNNFLGLIPIFPGGGNVMGNIAVAFTLAFIVLIVTLVIGNKHYWSHILWMPGVPAWVKIFLLTPIEVIGVFQRPFVLMIRIFANVAAGHIVILSFVSLIFIFGSTSDAGGWGFAPVSMAFTLFMNVMELLVAFLQAYVFTLLTAMYIGSCVEEPHHVEEKH